MEQIDKKTLVKKARQHLENGSLQEALRIYQDILAIDPEYSQALHDLGMIQFDAGNISEAILLLEKTTQHEDKRPDFHNNLGTVLKASGDLAAAEKAFRKALTLDRNLVPALVNIGSLLIERGRIPAALKALKRAIELAPENSTALSSYAEANKANGDIIEALNSQLQAAKVDPLADFIWLNLANTHMDLEQWVESFEAVKKSLILSPNRCESWSNLGFIKVNFGEFFLAERYFIQALIIKSYFAPSYSGLAEVNYLQNQLDNALNFSALAIQNSPQSPYHYQSRRALQLLAKGSIIEGWELKEARLKLDHSIDHRGRPPRWEGQPLHNKSLLITAEEGIGDEIFFASCFNDAIGAAEQCLIECDPRLVSLFQRSFPDAAVREVERTGSRLKPVQSYYWLPQDPKVDMSIETGSLFRFFRPTLNDFHNTVPYLVPCQNLQQKWNERISELGPGINIGFCWRSKYPSVFRNHHYTQLTDWEKIFEFPRANFISLQYGTDWQQEIDALPPSIRERITVFKDADMSDDMETVFAIASNLDLIISPSSTVSWIGGSLNISTWVFHLRPNHTQLGTSHFPGFPSMRSFPKNISETWDTCFSKIYTELKNTAANRPLT